MLLVEAICMPPPLLPLAVSSLEAGSDLRSFTGKDVALILMATLGARCTGRAGSVCSGEDEGRRPG